MSYKIFIREIADEWNYFIRKIRHRAVKKVAESVLMDLDIFNAIEGARSSAKLEREHFLSVPTFKKRKQLFKFVLEASDEQCLALEFGTYKGNSINMLAKLQPNRQFYAFDSFEGLPEGWTPGARKGSFTTNRVLPAVRKNVRVIPGFFENTLEEFLQSNPNQCISFVHIDCDLYSSTLTVLEYLHPRFKIGTTIVFDEYYNYAEWMDGEYKAWMEYCANKKVTFEYIGYIRVGGQVAIRITKI